MKSYMPNSRLKPIDEVRRDVAHLKNTVKELVVCINQLKKQIEDDKEKEFIKVDPEKSWWW